MEIVTVPDRGGRDVALKGFGAGACFEPHLRQQRALALPHFGFSGAPVRRGFADAGIRRYRLINGIVNGELLGTSRTHRDTNTEEYCNYLKNIHKAPPCHVATIIWGRLATRPAPNGGMPDDGFGKYICNPKTEITHSGKWFGRRGAPKFTAFEDVTEKSHVHGFSHAAWVTRLKMRSEAPG